jgi:hypothetical protein
MASGQTSYIQDLVAALAGQPAEPFNPDVMRSYVVAAGNTAGIPFGIFVGRSGADDTVDLPSSAAMVTTTGAGVAVLNVAREPHSATAIVDGGTIGYIAKDPVTVMRHGRIWVLTEGAVAYGDQAYVRIVANGAGKLQLGAFRNDVDNATTDHATILAGAKFLTTLAAAGLAILEF